jgi:hypothetical protein
MATRKAATKARTVQKAKAKPLGPPVKATAANTVVVMDLGYGDVFELVEQVELRNLRDQPLRQRQAAQGRRL